MSSLSFISFNARGLRDNTKRKALLLYAKSLNTDFCMIQESHSGPSDEHFWKSQWGEDLWMSHGTNHSAGTLTLKHKFNGKVISSVTDPKGHFVLLIVSFNDQIFLLGNLYGYNNKQDNITLIQLVNTKIDNLISKYKDLKIIFGGDWNCSLNDNLDRWPNRSNDYNTYMLDFMNERDLVDIWRYKNPAVKEFTWKNKQGTLQSRIDYWLISDSLSEYITTVKMLPTPLTDHKSIFIELSMSASRQSKRVNSYWKLNNTLLSDESLVNEIKTKICECWENACAENMYGKNWEFLKFELRSLIMKRGAEIVKNRKKEETELISEIITSSSQLPENLSEDDRKRLQILQLRLDNVYIHKAKGAFVRSRRRWLEEGEQNSIYFFKLEKRRNNYNSMVKLRTDENVIQDPKKISELCETFYKKLYESKLSLDNMESFFNSLGDIKGISNSNKDLCEAAIRVNDIEDAIKKLKLNKSPGNDGLTSEFYKLFSKELSRFLHMVYLESFENGKLPPS